MNTLEQIAILTSLKKVVDSRLKEIRAEADHELESDYQNKGVEKIALKLDGSKVGDFLVTFKADGFEITDKEAFNEFALDYGLATIHRTIRPEMMESCIKALEDVFEPNVLEEAIQEDVVLVGDWEKGLTKVGNTVCYMDSNMIVPGVEYRPKEPKGTMVRGCKPEEVLPVVQRLGGVDRLLLSDGNE